MRMKTNIKKDFSEITLFLEGIVQCPATKEGVKRGTNRYTVKKGSRVSRLQPLTKLPLGRNNSVMTSFFPPRESLVVTSRLGTANSRTFFLRCRSCLPTQSPMLFDTLKELLLRFKFQKSVKI